MWFQIPEPILAADIGGLGCVAVIVMMFVGWIMNLVNKNKERPAQAARRQARRPPREGGERLHSEIDNFLQEVGGGRRQADVKLEEFDDLEIELVPEEEQVRKPRRRRPQSQSPRRKSQPAEQVKTPLSERHLETTAGSSDLGGGLREHQQEFLQQDHISDEVVGDLGRRTGGGAARRKTARRPDVNPEAVRGTAASMSGGIVEILRNPATVRQAILISEILSPPKSRRR
ncbi:MAG: hypothetical protein HOL01_02115 [Planctomycetaceae bacterium]|jgi:hypothetical protein|nr:hypothetical protein [Planctomycetaceae bacterium]MBT6486692.1 hypothetical protein [Planctomycetaceae bacterium]MBT6493323.1 hypothetical protein [Planctomycetaceae bacterium]